MCALKLGERWEVECEFLCAVLMGMVGMVKGAEC